MREIVDDSEDLKQNLKSVSNQPQN